MSKPEHTRPFSIDHAKAGAPFCGSNGEAVRVLIWDRKHPTHPILAIEEAGDQEAVAFRGNGTANHGCGYIVAKLVMTPLGYIEGKPVWADSKIITQHDCEIEALAWFRQGEPFDSSRWPAPAKQYPVTQMSESDICSAFFGGGRVVGAHEELQGYRRIANAALRHACENDQIVPIAEVREVARNMHKAERAARDMAIALSVVHEYERRGAFTIINLAAIIASVPEQA